MPVVGDSERFAVEYELNEKHGGVWMFGRFCYWCAGKRIGDFDVGTSLRDVLFQLDQLARDNGSRANRRFSMLSGADVFRLLDGVLFGDDEMNNERIAEDEQWARHQILPPVDVFDGWKGFLVEDNQGARLILACEPFEDVAEVALQPGEVDEALDRARRALDAIYSRELLDDVGEER